MKAVRSYLTVSGAVAHPVRKLEEKILLLLHKPTLPTNVSRLSLTELFISSFVSCLPEAVMRNAAAVQKEKATY